MTEKDGESRQPSEKSSELIEPNWQAGISDLPPKNPYPVLSIDRSGQVIYANDITERKAAIRDISERKQAEETIQHLADYDILTELPNRRLFSHLLDKTQAQMKRADKLLALLYLDLDGFKQVNDTFGHDVGDYLLTATASRISKQIRESDVAMRHAKQNVGNTFTFFDKNVDLAA